MPIYTYRCGRCGEEIEIQHSMTELDLPHLHCGIEMQRLPSLFNVSVPLGNRNRVLKALNGELPLPARQTDRPRLEKALAKGLDRTRPVIGIGF